MVALELYASCANFCLRAENSSLGYASHTRRGAYGAPFNQGRYHRDFFLHAQLVHALIIRNRFRIVKREVELSKEKSLRSFCFFHGSIFVPSRSDRRLGRCFAFFRGHGLKAALSADLATPTAHLCHNLRDHGAV